MVLERDLGVVDIFGIILFYCVILGGKVNKMLYISRK